MANQGKKDMYLKSRIGNDYFFRYNKKIASK